MPDAGLVPHLGSCGLSPLEAQQLMGCLTTCFNDAHTAFLVPQDYIHSLKSCLTLVQSRASAAVVFRRFAIEAQQLVGCLKICNTDAYTAILQRQWGADVGPPGTLSSPHKTDAEYYERYMVCTVG